MSFERASFSSRPRATVGCNCANTPLVYKPVCGNDFWTYGNECMAYCANVLVAHTGACGKCNIRYGSAFRACASGRSLRRCHAPVACCQCATSPSMLQHHAASTCATKGLDASHCEVAISPGRTATSVFSSCNADCICGSSFNFVCAFGLTWQSTCDADCGGYTCPQTPGVCQYKANSASGQLVTPQGRAKPGGGTRCRAACVQSFRACNMQPKSLKRLLSHMQ